MHSYVWTTIFPVMFDACAKASHAAFCSGFSFFSLIPEEGVLSSVPDAETSYCSYGRMFFAIRQMGQRLHILLLPL